MIRSNSISWYFLPHTIVYLWDLSLNGGSSGISSKLFITIWSMRVKCWGVISNVMFPLCCDKINFLFCCNMKYRAFLLCFSAIRTIRLVDAIAHSTLLHIGWVWTSPLINFLFTFKIASSSEWTATTFEAFWKTLSISSSSATNKLPVEDPAKSLIPQQPSKPLDLLNHPHCLLLLQNKKHNCNTFYF